MNRNYLFIWRIHVDLINDNYWNCECINIWNLIFRTVRFRKKKTITNKKQSFWLCKRQKHELNQIEEISMPKTKTAWIEKSTEITRLHFNKMHFTFVHTHTRAHTHTRTHTHTHRGRARAQARMHVTHEGNFFLREISTDGMICRANGVEMQF